MSRGYLTTSLLLALCVGCGGPDAAVQGTVTIDGELANRGTVVFHPVKDGPTAYGSIAENGTYVLRVGKGDLQDPNSGGVPSGEYIVTVSVNMPSAKDVAAGEGGPPTPGARLSSSKYAAKDTSDLRATVKPGENVVPLDVKGSADDEPAAAMPESDGATVKGEGASGVDAAKEESAVESAPPVEGVPEAKP